MRMPAHAQNSSKCQLELAAGARVLTFCEESASLRVAREVAQAGKLELFCSNSRFDQATCRNNPILRYSRPVAVRRPTARGRGMRRILLVLFAVAGTAAFGNGQAPGDRPRVLPVTTVSPLDIAAAKPIRQAVASDVPAAAEPLPPPVETPVPCPAQSPELIERLGTFYNNGFVLMESSDPERIPFKLVVANFAQMRYTNT